MGQTTMWTAMVACLLGGSGWWLLHPGRPGGDATAPPSSPLSWSADLCADETAAPASPAVMGKGLTPFPILSATTPAEVREVLRLTRAATSQDQAALIDAALRAQDPLVAGSAARALGRLRVFAGDPALLALTTDPRPRVRQDAVLACGLDGRPATIPYLQRALALGDASLRPLVFTALGKVGGQLAEEVLRRVAADEVATATDRVFARSALAACRASDQPGTRQTSVR